MMVNSHSRTGFRIYVRSMLLALATLLLSACLEKDPLVDILQAENIRQVSDGRIFITGKEALFQLQASDGGGYETLPITSDSDECNYYAGLTELNGWLFFVCAQSAELSFRDLKFKRAGLLKAYSLTDERLVTVMELSGYQFPNGLDAMPADNSILIADEDFFLAQGGVSKARFDFSTGEPLLTDYQYRWIGPDQEVYAANGVRVVGDEVYLTDIGFFKRVAINPDGTPAQSEVLFKSLTVLDDFDHYCNGFLITDFVKGRLVYVPLNGMEPVITGGGLNSPSAVLGSGGFLFEAGDILVTESAGLQGSVGNQLLRVRVGELAIDGCLAQ